MKAILFLVSVWIIVGESLVFGQHYDFKTYSTGLSKSHDQINIIYQDSKSFIWLGTNGGGLLRFDGINFVNFTQNEGLNGNNVKTIIEDSLGNLLLGTNKGVNYYNHRMMVNLNDSLEIRDQIVYVMYVDRSKRLWVGIENGLHMYSGSILKKFNRQNGFVDSQVRSILEDRKGKIWISTFGDGIWCHENESIQVVLNNDKVIGKFVHHSRIDSKGNIWFGTGEEGILRFSNGKFRRYSISEGTGDITSFSILEDSKNNIWFSMLNGISFYRDNKFNSFTSNTNLSSNLIVSMLEDKENNLWFATWGSGLSKMVAQSYSMFQKENGILNDFIWSVYKDTKNRVWAGTSMKGLCIFPDQNAPISNSDGGNLRVQERLINDRIYCIREIGDKIIVGTSAMGLKVMGEDAVSNKLKLMWSLDTSHSLGSNLIRSTFIDHQQNLWLGTDNGISVIKLSDFLKREHNFQLFSEVDGLSNNYVYEITEDTKGKIWIATAKGVSQVVYDEDSFPKIKLLKKYTSESGLMDNDVRNICIDPEGKVLIGTMNGINIYNPKDSSFDYLLPTNGLTDKSIFQMRFDKVDSNILWIGTSLGIDKFDYGSYRESGEKYFYHYTVENGFIEEETNTNAFMQDENSNLWIGTINGLIKFDPNFKAVENTLTPALHMVNIKVNNVDTILHDYAELNYAQNHIVFKFVGICFSNPKKVKYKYKLTNLGNEWSPEFEENTISFTNLSPANYTLSLISCNNQGVWNEEPLLFNFRINPPYWETGWYYAGQILFFIIMIGGTMIVSRAGKAKTLILILVFICLFVIFEFIQNLCEPFYENYVGSAPLVKTLLNLILASLLLPIQTILRKYLLGLKRKSNEKLKEEKSSE